MKVKFENCEVELWSAKMGSIVMAKGQFGYISRIGYTEGESFEENVFAVKIITVDEKEILCKSSDITWLAPH